MKLFNKKIIFNSFLYLLLLIMSLVAIFPLIWIVITSIRPSVDMASNPLSLIPRSITFDYYRQVLFELNFIRNIRNSLFISLVSTVITVIISSLGAYGIVRFFPNIGKKMTRLLIITYMFPSILLAIPYITVMAKMELINTWSSVVITYFSFSIPYAIWMLIGFFQTVPIGIEEAAIVDGVGKFGVFFKITVPIVMPGIVSTAIYTFINTWNEFLYALLLINTSEKMPLSIALYSLTGSEILDWGQMMAASVIVILPSIIFFMIIQKKIVGGLSEGAVK